jgi:hypothetical protein
MPCPFCLIASSIPPSSAPQIITSPLGSAFPLLSTPTVIAFLDIAPVSRGHILLCPRAHREKNTDLVRYLCFVLSFLSVPFPSSTPLCLEMGGLTQCTNKTNLATAIDAHRVGCNRLLATCAIAGRDACAVRQRGRQLECSASKRYVNAQSCHVVCDMSCEESLAQAGEVADTINCVGAENVAAQ